MNLGTAVVLLVVVAIVALAVRATLKKRGGCSCGCSSTKEESSECSSCSGCSQAKVYGINVDAEGMPMKSSDCPHCAH